MTENYPDYYRLFHCTGGQCPDTCCSGWEVVLDSETSAFYRSCSGGISEKLKSFMYTENGETKFRMLPNGDCPFLNRQHLCDIYSCLGREHLSRTCALYPRYINEFGAHRETGLSMSCPEAVRIIMSQTSPVSYYEIKTDEKLSGYNSIDPIKYMCLKTARSHILDILQDRSRSINLRLANALDYAEYIEKMVHRRAYGKIDYSHIPHRETISGHNCQKLINAWFSHLDKMEFLRPSWKNRLSEARQTAFTDCHGFGSVLFAAENEFEQIAVYYTARYFLSSVYGGSISSCIKAAVLCICVCREIMRHDYLSGISGDEYRWEIYRLYSREIEHCQENMDALLSLFSKKRSFTAKSMKSVLFCKV